MRWRVPIVLVAVLALGPFLLAQVSSDRLLNAQKEPHNWLTYSGSYMSQRHSPLTQITTANVKDLELKWVFQARWLDYNQATPLVVDGIMYTTQGNDVVALDAATGKMFWIYPVRTGLRREVVLRPHYARSRDPRRHALSGGGRRASDCHRREDRTPDLEPHRGVGIRIFDDRPRRWSSRTR